MPDLKNFAKPRERKFNFGWIFDLNLLRRRKAERNFNE